MLARHDQFPGLIVGDRRIDYLISNEVEETTPYYFPSWMDRKVESHLV